MKQMEEYSTSFPEIVPYFRKIKNPTGGFRINSARYWDTAATKWITIKIPVTTDQMMQLEALFDEYAEQTPYDYAVFGMRCAAASYDVLSEIGLVKKVSDKQNIIKNFYPKLLRKRMLKWAEKKQLPCHLSRGK